MLPQIASQPRYLPQEHPAAAFEALPFRTSKKYSSFGATRAFPVQTSAEHLLRRRKTPHGVVSETDVSCPPSATKPPALKHIILPDFGNLSTSRSYDAVTEVELLHLGTDLHNIQSRETLLPSTNGRGHDAQLSEIQQGPVQRRGNDFQMPTVLHEGHQPSSGPTASDDGDIPGFFWSNGGFVPHRSSPNQQRRHSHTYHEPKDLPYLQQQHSPQSQASRSHNSSFDHFVAVSNYAHEHFIPGSLVYERVILPSCGTYSSNQHGSQQPRLPVNSDAIKTSYQKSRWAESVVEASKVSTFHPMNQTNNSRFKEKTLSWAHGIYVDLLAYLQRSKREIKSKDPHNPRFQSKNSIYPKPPSGKAYIRPVQWVEDNPQRNTLKSYNDIKLKSNYSASLLPDANQSQPPDRESARYTRPLLYDAPHYVSPFQLRSQVASSPLSKAREALEILNTLCDQSSWQWIDGMLLGGCLAYGLEDYNIALEWYFKIITLDPKHVEAISNFAATLLCLNRREEAEQYWLQTVKICPSYFEAVEHLIGLLCGDHRGQEAVGIIQFVERSLRLLNPDESHNYRSETSSNTDYESYDPSAVAAEAIIYDNDSEGGIENSLAPRGMKSKPPGFASSGFAIAGTENGRILALIHAKANMLYALGDIHGASKAFEDAILISAGSSFYGIQDLIRKIIEVLSLDGINPLRADFRSSAASSTSPPLLLPPDKALQTARLVFTKDGDLPGLRYVPDGLAKKAAISTTSNSLLSLAKIIQDSMSNSSSRHRLAALPWSIGDVLALYYLSLSLQPSPSTANNVGILLASVQPNPSRTPLYSMTLNSNSPTIPGVIPGSGVALALAYYNYGLNLDSRHAHIYTNLGSLLKDIGQLAAAITMYEKAVSCDGSFDIALANLANAVKDQGRTSEAIKYYRRAVATSPNFSEAVCGLANALNSVCNWRGRGGVILDNGKQDRWHVDENGMIMDGSQGLGSGWMKRVVEIVSKQLKDGSTWGYGTLQRETLDLFLIDLEAAECGGKWPIEKMNLIRDALMSWIGSPWEGARIVRIIERATRRAMHRWYLDKYVTNKHFPSSHYRRPQIPSSLSVPSAPTVLPFHTFTYPLSAKDIRMISQRNALRISCSTLKSTWLQNTVFPPPPPPRPHLNIGYVSSDFNNHPLAHLQVLLGTIISLADDDSMQSVFGLHDPYRAKAFCYATTVSDNSPHRRQIEREAPVFRDVNSWTADRLVEQIVRDEIHILVNLNGYTRGARNEVFAARPAPIQMSFMGFAGTLGAEWCDYLLADETAIPLSTLKPWRKNIDLEDQILDERSLEASDWVYSENIIFCRDSFFCCDHAQSEPRERHISWEEEQARRWQMRKNLFPSLSDDAVILGNFNQLYKIEPTTFRTWLRILDKVPKAILWLLRFPDLGETNLKRTALEWAGESVASRIWFTDVAPKHEHISRARVCDLFLDTPECNAHTTAADVLWSSTPLLTLPRYNYKMCSRMAASILKGAFPDNEEGRRAARELTAGDDAQYEEIATSLTSTFYYKIHPSGFGQGSGRLGELRKLLHDNRWTCALFDTKRWVSDLESAYEEAWRRWVVDEGGDIFL